MVRLIARPIGGTTPEEVVILSRRERTVLVFVAAGYSTKVIAALTGLATSTIGTYLKEMRRALVKSGPGATRRTLDSRAELQAWACQNQVALWLKDNAQIPLALHEVPCLYPACQSIWCAALRAALRSQ